MNWTGGPRSRHYQNNVRSTANLQRQHFAKVRTRLYSKAQLPPPFAEVQSGGGRDIPPYHHHRGRAIRGGQADERRASGGVCVTLEAPYFTSQLLHRSNSLTRAESGAATCDQGRARTQRSPLPAAVKGDVNFNVEARATRRHRLSKTPDPRNTPPVVNKKRKLLKRDDWAGTTITRPLKIKPAEDWQMIGRRHKQAGGYYRHHILPADEQVGLPDARWRGVARGDGSDWTAGQQGLVVRIEGLLASEEGRAGIDSAETIRGAFSEPSGHIKGIMTPELMADLSNSGANPTLSVADSTAGSAAGSQIHNDSSMVATRRAPRGNMCCTESSKDGTSPGSRLGFPAASGHGSSAGYRDTGSKTSIGLDTPLPSDTHLDSLRLTGDSTNRNTLGEPVCNSSCEGKEIWPNKPCKKRNKYPLSYIRSGSRGEAASQTITFFPNNTQEGSFATGNSLRVGIRDSSVSGIRRNGGTGTSTAPDELFWRSWLSTFIRSASITLEVEGQTETSYRKSRFKC